MFSVPNSFVKVYIFCREFRFKKNEKPFHQQGAKENKALNNQEAPKHVQLYTK